RAGGNGLHVQSRRRSGDAASAAPRARGRGDEASGGQLFHRRAHGGARSRRRYRLTAMIFMVPLTSVIQISPLPIMTPWSRANRLSGFAAATAALISGVKTCA